MSLSEKACFLFEFTFLLIWPLRLLKKATNLSPSDKLLEQNVLDINFFFFNECSYDKPFEVGN